MLPLNSAESNRHQIATEPATPNQKGNRNVQLLTHSDSFQILLMMNNTTCDAMMLKRDNACTDETAEGRRRKCSEYCNGNDDDNDDDDASAEMVVACNWPTETAPNMP